MSRIRHIHDPTGTKRVRGIVEADGTTSFIVNDAIPEASSASSSTTSWPQTEGPTTRDWINAQNVVETPSVSRSAVAASTFTSAAAQYSLMAGKSGPSFEDMYDDAGKLERDLQSKDEYVRYLEKQLEGLQKIEKDLEVDITEKSNAIEHYKKEVQEKSENLMSAEKEMGLVQNEKAEFQKKIDTLQNEVDAANGKIHSLQSIGKELEDQIRGRENQCAQLFNEREIFKAQSDKTQEEYQDLEHKYGVLQTELGKFTSQDQEMEDAIEDTIDQIGQLQDKDNEIRDLRKWLVWAASHLREPMPAPDTLPEPIGPFVPEQHQPTTKTSPTSDLGEELKGTNEFAPIQTLLDQPDQAPSAAPTASLGHMCGHSVSTHPRDPAQAAHNTAPTHTILDQPDQSASAVPAAPLSHARIHTVFDQPDQAAPAAPLGQVRGRSVFTRPRDPVQAAHNTAPIHIILDQPGQDASAAPLSHMRGHSVSTPPRDPVRPTHTRRPTDAIINMPPIHPAPISLAIGPTMTSIDQAPRPHKIIAPVVVQHQRDWIPFWAGIALIVIAVLQTLLTWKERGRWLGANEWSKSALWAHQGGGDAGRHAVMSGMVAAVFGLSDAEMGTARSALY